MYELTITNGNDIYYPSIIEPVTLNQELSGSPSILKFTVVKGQVLNFQEGNAVRLLYNGEPVFYGFVFTKKRNKDKHIEVTAYDQIRYLKNKDTILFENVTINDILVRISKSNNLNLAKLPKSTFKIKSLLCDDVTYIDMINEAFDIILTQKKEYYILYDDFGKLTINKIGNMKLDDVILTADNTEDYDYTTTIDKQTYNQIKLVYDNEKSGKREVYLTKDSNSINRFGLLQYYESIDENVNGKLKADVLLELYNKKTRTLKLKGVSGNVKIRPGVQVLAYYNLGDMILKNYVIVSSVKHEFELDNYTMDLSIIGGGFSE